MENAVVCLNNRQVRSGSRLTRRVIPESSLSLGALCLAPCSLVNGLGNRHRLDSCHSASLVQLAIRCRLELVEAGQARLSLHASGPLRVAFTHGRFASIPVPVQSVDATIRGSFTKHKPDLVTFLHARTQAMFLLWLLRRYGRPA